MFRDNVTMRFELIESTVIYEHFFKLQEYRLRHESFRGGWCSPITRIRIESLRAVSVLLYDPIRDEVVLVEQFRIGALDDTTSSWLLETVGGYWGPGEQPPDVARREAREEAGCELLALESIGEFYVSPGLSSERIALFCGCVNAADVAGVHGLADEGEETRVVVLSHAEAQQALFGRINSTSALIALQWLGVNAARLQQEWRVVRASV